MRLINTATMELEDFMADPPPYAILSHTWSQAEVSFQDFTQPDRAAAAAKAGFAKIQHTCRIAKQNGLEYVWVDTCCIDKTSSAELSEAINSMFKWYAASEVCYAILADLAFLGPQDAAEAMPALAACRWFTRGWTLQELIAPRVVEFYDCGWNLRGTKSSLSKVLRSITGIDEEVLHDSSVLPDTPVARRMSWAAPRRTTRVEDIAYCLLGIFDISMPMLYGEGEGAFRRLQEEIAKDTNDLTLFAWKRVTRQGDRGPDYCGILAASPAEFRDAGSIVSGDDVRFNEEFVLTNKGMRIRTALCLGPDATYLLKLNCSLQGDASQQLGIHLKQHGAGLYARARPDELAVQSEWGQMADSIIYISKRLTPSQSVAMGARHRRAIFFRSGLHNPLFYAGTIQPVDLWDSQRRMFLTHGLSSFVGFMTLSLHKVLRDRKFVAPFIVVCGITAVKGQEAPAPWAVVGDTRGQPELWAAVRDMKKLGEAALRSGNTRVTVVSSSNTLKKDSFTVSVEVEEAVVEGETVYCVDLKIQDDMGIMDKATIKTGPVVPTGRML